MTPVNSNRYLFEKLRNSQILRPDLVLNQIHFFKIARRQIKSLIFIKRIYSFVWKSESMEGIESEIRFTYIIDEEDWILELSVAIE